MFTHLYYYVCTWSHFSNNVHCVVLSHELTIKQEQRGRVKEHNAEWSDEQVTILKTQILGF